MISVASKIKRLVLFIGDIIILYFSLWLTLFLRFQKAVDNETWAKHWLPFSLVFLLWIVIFFINKLYDLETARNNFRFYALMIKNIIWCAMIGFAFFYITTTGITPKTILVLDIIIFGTLIIAWRRFFNTIIVNKKFLEKALIIGLSEESLNLAREINNKPQMGIKVAAIFKSKDNSTPPPDTPLSDNGEKLEFLEGEEKLEKFINDNKIRIIIIANSQEYRPEVISQLYKLLSQKITIWDFSKFAEQFTGKILINTIGQLWFLENIKEANKRIYETQKRVADFVLSLIMLFISIPFLPIIYFTIRATSEGPGFFMQQRTGKNGKKFMAVKFRTMVVEAEKNGPQWAQKNDPRVTRIGRFLRKSRIDEIPQLVNILRGEMSFIGPRPERPEFIEKLKEVIPFYETRLLVKPGLTGWAQINFPYGASEKDAWEKLQYDLYYIKNRSLVLDISIILKTVKTVLTGGGQ
ncbi:sugar transferase [Candidatus Kuenenbacteria bacterium]|nr:sugar transferase [Candidatus Kuenenbacteria bacterium]